ncbi:MAG: metalloregulator ArsR/SmtB family transcription factor [Clostridia bacterium]|nr:metalloregulator ArsR/SmtB family transcription factor [Clostridia bacterium]
MRDIMHILKALSDETRVRIVNLLYEQEMCVCDVMETLKITQAKASRHLNYLKNAGLVLDRKHAQWVYYKLTRGKEANFLDLLVVETLRNTEMFQTDLSHLKSWLDRKNIKCD